jgi:hypothetical protein
VQILSNDVHFATAACAFRAWAQGPANPVLQREKPFWLARHQQIFNFFAALQQKCLVRQAFIPIIRLCCTATWPYQGGLRSR